jgi:hypothetical protein
MSETVPVLPEPAVESETLLEEMGYKPELDRELNIVGNIALAWRCSITWARRSSCPRASPSV